MRKPRNAKYTIRAYYILNNVETLFYCKEVKLRNITNEMGAPLQLSNGERMLETDSSLEFKINAQVKIGNETLRIQQANHELDNNYLNAMRGKPRYITRMTVR